MKYYKLYFKELDNNSKYYVRALTFGGDPFVQIIPAWFEEDIGIYEEDKANAYVKMLQEQNPKGTLEFGKEEIGNGKQGKI